MTPEIRALFPITQRYIYLNHAAVSPLSTRAVSAMRAQMDEVAEHGTHRWTKWMVGVEATRKAIAKLIHTSPGRIAFMPNTSTGISTVANGIEWLPGDNVVSAECEFPANIYPWMILRDRGVELRLARERDGRVDVDELCSLIDERTRVVTVSFVQFASGQRMDLEQIASTTATRDTLLVVDGIQGLGALRLDAEGLPIDALAADGHKFLMGPEGAGFLYLSRKAFERVRPTALGWMSVQGSEDFLQYSLMLREDLTRFEPGTLNALGIHGLGAAIDTLLEVGIDRIERHLIELTDRLVQGLETKGYRVVSPRSPREKSPIVSVEHRAITAEELFRRLRERRIIAAARAGRLRFAPHLYNTLEEIETTLDALPD